MIMTIRSISGEIFKWDFPRDWPYLFNPNLINCLLVNNEACYSYLAVFYYYTLPHPTMFPGRQSDNLYGSGQACWQTTMFPGRQTTMFPGSRTNNAFQKETRIVDRCFSKPDSWGTSSRNLGGEPDGINDRKYATIFNEVVIWWYILFIMIFLLLSLISLRP